LSGKIKAALLDLNFEDVRFEISIQNKDQAGPDGQDQVCFLISTNPGIPMGPLQEIASGGELSRIMLAIKSILADEEQIETLIFDEIDAGISGRTAQKVSERLKEIAKGRQVIAITHLPQIAALGTTHYRVSKEETATGTTSQMQMLSPDERIHEIAQMLSGSDISAAAIQNAKELLKL
jgi:DNA repair protein RecN (Recombination protein N)